MDADLAVLEGPGHERRAARLYNAFHRSGRPSRKHWMFRRLRWRARDLGLLCFGGFLGASAVALLDSHQAAGDRWTYFANCREAFQSGAASIPAGSPGYRPELDADSDGIACEPYRGP